jgi:methylated-DNA-[protein]-cysteine S-methyltransferase
MTTRTCTVPTPLGPVTAAADARSLTGLWFIGQKHYPADAESWTADPRHPLFEALRAWLDFYFAGQDPGPRPPLAPQGTAFQLAVWERLLAVPRGRVTTYGQIAADLGRPATSARAVGGAVGRNPVSILIPCHRVVGSDGRLTGYAGGLERKAALLRLESAFSG